MNACHVRYDIRFAVAVRDREDLFLWLRLRRAPAGDIYYMIPTARPGPEWKRWNPHGSLHKDGVFHHKSFNRKFDPAQIIQKPDASWKGTKNLVTRPTPARDPRAFGEICVPAEFSEIMEIPVELLNPRTCVSVDVTDAKRVPTLVHPQTRVLAQRVFLEPPPHIVVTVQDPGEVPEA